MSYFIWNSRKDLPDGGPFPSFKAAQEYAAKVGITKPHIVQDVRKAQNATVRTADTPKRTRGN